MYSFNYLCPKSLAEATAALAEKTVAQRIIAGGTDLLVQMHEKDARFKNLDRVVDITKLTAELRYIREDETRVYIGALATHTDLETSSLIQKYLPCLGVASGTVGSPQIRNRGTIGGSICNASPASDPLPALILADAQAEITGCGGSRSLPLSALYKDKGELDLQPGELVSGFWFPKLPEDTKTCFVKLGRRKALAIARLNVAAALRLCASGEICEARIAPGCIFTAPTRVTSAEKLLLGQKPSPEVFEQAGAEVAEEMIRRTGVRWSTEYKKPAVAAVVYDALAGAMEWEAE